VKSGDALSVHDVTSPIIIKRGDLVTMKVETPTVVISTRGKAQGNAAVGQSVQVMNLESKRLIEGVVKDSQTIIIPVAGH
jgi:flagella basal body P-ring formation protein FlgA